MGNKGALSKIGLTHPVLFAVWGIITSAALFFCVIVGYSKTKYKFHIFFLAAAAAGMLLTLCFDFDYSKQLKYWLHCIGSMTFSVTMGIVIFLLFLVSKKYLSAAVSAAIMLIDLVFLIIFKETAIIELAPIFAGLIMLNIHNSRKERITVGAFKKTQ